MDLKLCLVIIWNKNFIKKKDAVRSLMFYNFVKSFFLSFTLESQQNWPRHLNELGIIFSFSFSLITTFNLSFNYNFLQICFFKLILCCILFYILISFRTFLYAIKSHLATLCDSGRNESLLKITDIFFLSKFCICM